MRFLRRRDSARTFARGHDPTTTFPLSSTAAQKLLPGQDTATSELAPSTGDTVHCAAPPIGLSDVMTLPWLSTVTQRPLLEQDTALRLVLLTWVSVQAATP